MQHSRLVPIVVGAALAAIVAGTATAQSTSLNDDIATWGSRWYYSMHTPAWADHALNVVTEAEGHPVRLGDSALRFEVRPGDCGRDDTWSDCENDRERHELAGGDQRDGQGETVWYAYSLFIPEGTSDVFPTKTTLGQFHEMGENVVFAMDLTPRGYIVEHKLVGWGDATRTIIPPEDLYGRWHDILVRATWSDGDDGAFDVWVNREHVYDYEGRTMRDRRGRGMYFKFGIYRTFISRFEGMNDGAPPPAQVVYYDEIRTGNSAARADRVGVTEIQEVLAEDGFFTSTIDGLWGPGTMGAVNGWLDAEGYEPVAEYELGLWHLIVQGEAPDTN